MNIYLVIILSTLILEYVLSIIVKKLNLKKQSVKLPSEFEDVFDNGKYKKSQDYTITNTKFSLLVSTISIIAIILFILLGGFNFVDKIVIKLKFDS